MVGLVRGRGGEAGAGDGDELAVQPPVVEPVDALERGKLHVRNALPGTGRVDQLPIIEPVERLHERIIERIALQTDRCDDVVAGQQLGVAHRKILNAAVAVMNESGQIVNLAAGVHGHLQRVNREVRP